MFGSQRIVCLATLVLGASALVLDSLHQRSGLTTAHRRHAANVLGGSVHPAKRSIAERRALRQKRCAQRNSTLSSTSVAATVSADNVPQNYAPQPSTTSPAADQQPQSTSPADNSSNNSSGNTDTGSGNGNGNGNTGSGGDPYTGDLTFYEAGLGACGGYNTDSDMIAAVGWQFFDSYGGGYTNPNNAPICNKPVIIDYQGKSITVTIVDRCGGCQPQDLDLTPTAFSQLADLGVGRLHGATWRFA